MKTHLGKQSNLKPLPHQSSLIWGEVWPWQCFILFMVQNLFGAVAHRYPFDYHKVGLCYSKPKGRKSLFLFYLLQFFFFFFLVLASSNDWRFLPHLQIRTGKVTQLEHAPSTYPRLGQSQVQNRVSTVRVHGQIWITRRSQGCIQDFRLHLPMRVLSQEQRVEPPPDLAKSLQANSSVSRAENEWRDPWGSSCISSPQTLAAVPRPIPSPGQQS